MRCRRMASRQSTRKTRGIPPDRLGEWLENVGEATSRNEAQLAADATSALQVSLPPSPSSSSTSSSRRVPGLSSGLCCMQQGGPTGPLLDDSIDSISVGGSSSSSRTSARMLRSEYEAAKRIALLEEAPPRLPNARPTNVLELLDKAPAFVEIPEHRQHNYQNFMGFIGFPKYCPGSCGNSAAAGPRSNLGQRSAAPVNDAAAMDAA